jgi:hypothetical protein
MSSDQQSWAVKVSYPPQRAVIDSQEQQLAAINSEQQPSAAMSIPSTAIAVKGNNF